MTRTRGRRRSAGTWRARLAIAAAGASAFGVVPPLVPQPAFPNGQHRAAVARLGVKASGGLVVMAGGSRVALFSLGASSDRGNAVSHNTPILLAVALPMAARL